MPRSLAFEILSAIASARGRRKHFEDGPSADRDFEVGEFEQLEICRPFDVEVQTGEAASVHASGPEWALDSLTVEPRGDALFIGCDGECDDSVDIIVTVRELRSLRTTGSGEVLR